jgi:hypothetical protein
MLVAGPTLLPVAAAADTLLQNLQGQYMILLAIYLKSFRPCIAEALRC